MAYTPYYPYAPNYFGNQYQNFQQMTPTIRAEIVQIDSEQAAKNYPVGAGASQMMIAKDESSIYVKTALQNGQYQFDVYVKRPPEPQEKPFDPSEYVRRDEIETLVAAILSDKEGKE